MTESNAAKKEFNYCFWAKLIVAIPALPLLAYIASLPFEGGIIKLIAAGVAVGLAIYGAMWLDRQPCLLKKVVNKQ